jgi:hypothetical protein
MDKIKYLCNASPQFSAGEDFYQAKPGFNEMDAKFTLNPYYQMCKDSKIVQDFVSSPTDKQHEEFDAQVTAERERADALQAELEELKAQMAAEVHSDSEKTAKAKK